MRFNITEPGCALPPGFPQEGPAFAGILPEEYMELVARGVWVESGTGNWTRVGANGSVWAGGEAGKVAQVRGKKGRKLGGGAGRGKMPIKDKRRTRSLNLSDVAVCNLAKLAEKDTQATGQKVTISMVVEKMARDVAV